jgi:UPF0716 protein FxsA
MRLLLILIILLGFPLAELAVLVKLANQYGWWVGAYLLFAAVLGWTLIQEERLAVFGRLYHITQSGHSPIVALLTSARRMVAGVLFIIPGVISDAIAVLILLIPMPTRRPPKTPDDVIEGEWRREE